jgi:hypothetical protein
MKSKDQGLGIQHLGMNPYFYDPPTPHDFMRTLAQFRLYHQGQGGVGRGVELLLYWWSRGLINCGGYR